MQLAMHGVVKSSASFEEGSRNGWWKVSTVVVLIPEYWTAQNASHSMPTPIVARDLS